MQIRAGSQPADGTSFEVFSDSAPSLLLLGAPWASFIAAAAVTRYKQSNGTLQKVDATGFTTKDHCSNDSGNPEVVDS